MTLRWPQPPPAGVLSAWPQKNSRELVHHSLWREHGNNEKICFGESLPAAEVVHLICEGRAQSVVQENDRWLSTDLGAALSIRENPRSYMQTPGEVLLGGVDSAWSWGFSDRCEKQELKQRLLSQCAEGTDSLRESIGLIFEELFMNAMIDAPREVLSLPPDSQPAEGLSTMSQMQLARRGDRVCLSCVDPYGTLKIPKFVGRMNEVYRQGAGQVINLNSDRGGAGLGCVILFENSAVLALGVAKGRRTVVSCVLPMNLNHRQRAALGKTLHLVEIDGGGFT